MSGRVIVVGSVNVDLVVTVDRLPGPGETVIGGRFAQHHGGKGGNQAVAAARLGATLDFVGAVGDRRIRDAGARGARRRRDRPVAALDARRRGDRRRPHPRRRGRREQHRGRRRREQALTPATSAAALERSARGRRTSSSSATRSRRRRRAGAALGRSRGATTILNPAPAAGWPADRSTLADILTPNDGELPPWRASGTPEADGADRLRSAGRGARPGEPRGGRRAVS